MHKKDDKNAQILQAATLEFLAKGLDSASMHNIAEIAQVSKRTLYKYYPSKDALYLTLVDDLLDQVYEMYKISYKPGVPFQRQLEELVQIRIEFITSVSFINVSKIIIGEMLKNYKISDQQLEKLASSDTQFLKWIDDAKAEGQITSNMASEIIANQFNYFIKGDVFWPVLLGLENSDSIDTTKIKTMVIEIFLNSFCRK